MKITKDLLSPSAGTQNTLTVNVANASNISANEKIRIAGEFLAADSVAKTHLWPNSIKPLVNPPPPLKKETKRIYRDPADSQLTTFGVQKIC